MINLLFYFASVIDYVSLMHHVHSFGSSLNCTLCLFQSKARKKKFILLIVLLIILAIIITVIVIAVKYH